MPEQKTKARFIEPMLLLRSDALPEGTNWAYELKLDGYRALAINTNGKVHLRSRNNKDFNAMYPAIANALTPLPDERVREFLSASFTRSQRMQSHAKRLDQPNRLKNW